LVARVHEFAHVAATLPPPLKAEERKEIDEEVKRLEEIVPAEQKEQPLMQAILNETALVLQQTDTNEALMMAELNRLFEEQRP
jgi:hypothetical protein